MKLQSPYQPWNIILTVMLIPTLKLKIAAFLEVIQAATVTAVIVSVV